ncbi:hypothetical protein, partial [Lentilactobacillus parabuchneri]|uniref:hypothetical protein n=2 Tax=Lentilactobacillus parabuchneri TaxID=152331 RepID=UPI001CDAC3AE
LAKMMANLSHIFGWIEKLSHIFQKKWKMRLNLFVGGTYVPATLLFVCDEAGKVSAFNSAMPLSGLNGRQAI